MTSLFTRAGKGEDTIDRHNFDKDFELNIQKVVKFMQKKIGQKLAMLILVILFIPSMVTLMP